MAESSMPPYGVAIHHAIASSDVSRMREQAAAAEDWLREHGDVSAALELLRSHIAKAEAKTA